jgi:hypothetical protein
MKTQRRKGAEAQRYMVFLASWRLSVFALILSTVVALQVLA